jgi:hypothetical protein
VFFDLVDGSDISVNTLSVSGTDVTDYQFDEDNVTDLGNGANLNGLDSKTGEELGAFDAGIEIGTQGISEDDISTTTFIISSSDSDPLTIEDIVKSFFNTFQKIRGHGKMN